MTQFLPISISSPQASPVKNNLRIAKVYWYNPANIGDTVVLNDDQGVLIWPGRCEVANQSQVFQLPRPVEVSGYQVPTIASGTLLLYLI